MKLRHRLSLYSLIIFSVIILIISSVIYFSFYTIMERKEVKGLESKSLLAAIYYLEKDEMSSNEHEEVRSQLQKTISKKNIAIFNEKGEYVSGNMPFDYTKSKEFIDDIKRNYKGYLITDDYFYNGIFYKDNEGKFIVITRELKTEFDGQLDVLLKILIVVSLVGLLFMYLFSQILGYVAYQPIIEIINQIKNRNTSNFNEPLQLKKAYAEVDDLIFTYNQFIHQIAQTFNVQKNFIDYVSHELRTPIAAIFGTLEVTKQKERTAEEYNEVLNRLRQYTTDLQETLDQMMLLSGAKTTFELKPIRVDEVVWQVIENAILYHQARIEVDLYVPNDQLLKINGNEKLLEVAIGNIIGNAIKYSDNNVVKVKFIEVENHLEINIIDQGIGILQEDIEQIKQNFYRGKNTQDYQGKGIGLSIANIIFKLHNIEIDIKQNNVKGTIIVLIFI